MFTSHLVQRLRLFYRSKTIFVGLLPQQQNRFEHRTYSNHRRLCRVKNMLTMYLKYPNAGLTPTTSVTSTVISPVKMLIGRKSLTNLRSEMRFLQGKPIFSSPGHRPCELLSWVSVRRPLAFHI